MLSSDRPPHEIPALEERLRSRFEWGLIADIQSPDLETKVAILKRKAEAEAVPLPDEVALFIAQRIKSNIRELEGSLIRLIAYASLTGRDISLELTQEVLRNAIDLDERAITLESIQRYVADHYQLKVADLKARDNSKSVALPRQVAMYLCKSLTQASLPEIGRCFGGKHHSTVIHSIKKIEAAAEARRFQHPHPRIDRRNPLNPQPSTALAGNSLWMPSEPRRGDARNPPRSAGNSTGFPPGNWLTCKH